jgi:hypothetical protein
MKYRFPKRHPARLLALAVATLAVISCVQSTLQSPSATTRVGGCDASPAFTLPSELSGTEPLKVKDGQYSLGSWRTSGGTVEIKVAVSSGRKSDPFLTLNGKRLKKEPIGQVPQKIQDCAAKLAGVTEQRTLLEVATDFLVPSAYAVSCKNCLSFKIVRDCDKDRCIYWLVGCGHVCGKSVGPPLSQ